MSTKPGITPLLVGRSLNKDKMDKNKLNVLTSPGLKSIVENKGDESDDEAEKKAKEKSKAAARRNKNALKAFKNIE